MKSNNYSTNQPWWSEWLSAISKNLGQHLEERLIDKISIFQLQKSTLFGFSTCTKLLHYSPSFLGRSPCVWKPTTAKELAFVTSHYGEQRIIISSMDIPLRTRIVYLMPLMSCQWVFSRNFPHPHWFILTLRNKFIDCIPKFYLF